jgi:predicted RNase H-like nuclease (RuvC/YqgF family)
MAMVDDDGLTPAQRLRQADIEAEEERAAGMRRALQRLRLQIRRLESELGQMELDNADLHMEIERLQAERQSQIAA